LLLDWVWIHTIPLRIYPLVHRESPMELVRENFMEDDGIRNQNPFRSAGQTHVSAAKERWAGWMDYLQVFPRRVPSQDLSLDCCALASS
jgi:hypothetical protein